MTATRILRSVTHWPMYAEEIGNDMLQLATMEERGLLVSYAATGGRRLYQITPKGKAWLQQTWWKRWLS